MKRTITGLLAILLTIGMLVTFAGPVTAHDTKADVENWGSVVENNPGEADEEVVDTIEQAHDAGPVAAVDHPRPARVTILGIRMFLDAY